MAILGTVQTYSTRIVIQSSDGFIYILYRTVYGILIYILYYINNLLYGSY